MLVDWSVGGLSLNHVCRGDRPGITSPWLRIMP